VGVLAAEPKGDVRLVAVALLKADVPKAVLRKAAVREGGEEAAAFPGAAGGIQAGVAG